MRKLPLFVTLVISTTTFAKFDSYVVFVVYLSSLRFINSMASDLKISELVCRLSVWHHLDQVDVEQYKLGIHYLSPSAMAP